jgi:hypothetical protein
MEKHDQLLLCQKDNSNDLQKFPKFESANRLALDPNLNLVSNQCPFERDPCI